MNNLDQALIIVTYVVAVVVGIFTLKLLYCWADEYFSKENKTAKKIKIDNLLVLLSYLAMVGIGVCSLRLVNFMFNK